MSKPAGGGDGKIEPAELQVLIFPESRRGWQERPGAVPCRAAARASGGRTRPRGALRARNTRRARRPRAVPQRHTPGRLRRAGRVGGAC